jgi:MFS superfamily sulfate permease-like transporter
MNTTNPTPVPLDYLKGLTQNWRSDLLSGGIISLIALPLCLGISLASGVPPISGLIAGIVGGMVLSLISGSHLTINGPAAGLAVIVLTAVEGYREMAPAGLSPDQANLFAYQATLGVGVACGVLQILFGFIRAGVLRSFFPLSVVHGMLAAIGIMIFVKQFHAGLGVSPLGKEMLEVILSIPNSVIHMNPQIATITAVSLLILIVLPLIPVSWIKNIPAPLVVILVAIPLGMYFNLDHEHKYLFLNNQEYTVGPQYLVTLPDKLLDGIVFPRFDYLLTGFGLQMILTYALVASLESLLTAAAIDKMDPYYRESDYNRELWAKGTGNIISSMIGGLPIIAEVVRSSANVRLGARTRWSNFFHGVFLLIFVVFLSPYLHSVPLAALSAILMVTGYRLASPQSFIHIYKIGKEQLILFITTILVTLLTDLLVGVFAGIMLKLGLNLLHGVPFKFLFIPMIRETENPEGKKGLSLESAAVFTSFMKIKTELDRLANGQPLFLDVIKAEMIDHSVLDSLEDWKKRYERKGGSLEIIGLEHFKPVSSHPLATRHQAKK